MEKIQIKNMVCDRCIHAVRKIFNQLEVRILHIDLGQVTISDPLNESKMEELERHLEKDGFELLKERQSEIKNAFSAKPLSYKRVLLVDDVMTTGSSLNELAKTLLKAGVGSCDVLTLARA